jgi:ankyrin repeat protein
MQYGLAIRIGNETIVDILIDGISPLRLALIPVRGGVKSVMGEVALVGNERLMFKLASSGFNRCIQDGEGKTLLHTAVESNHEAVVRYLLQNMSAEEVNIRYADGNQAVDVALAAGFENMSTLLISTEVGS